MRIAIVIRVLFADTSFKHSSEVLHTELVFIYRIQSSCELNRDKNICALRE